MKPLWMNKGVAANVGSSGNRTTVPFRVSLGPDEIIELWRVTFAIYSVDVTPTLDAFRRWMIALSSADLEPEDTVTDTSSPVAFYNRNDLFVYTQETQLIITNADGISPGHHDEMVFPEPYLLPRSPSLVVLNQLGTDACNCSSVLYYKKRKASQEEIMMLMKQYKSIKPASVPRVIDE